MTVFSGDIGGQVTQRRIAAPNNRKITEAVAATSNASRSERHAFRAAHPLRLTSKRSDALQAE